MNIYALKVKCTSLDQGYNFHIERAQQYLEIGKLHTVYYTEVHSESTDVYLEEFPGTYFNATCFEDV